jgi:CHC2 zinc finger/DNA primase catalytic core, N-terminal domain
MEVIPMTPKPSASRSSTFIDFQQLKQQVTMEDAITHLGLSTKKLGEQHRGPCPACNKGGDRTLVITPAKQAFYCFAGGQGGDVIALTAHIKQLPMKEAAAFLAEASGLASPPPAKNARPQTVPVTVPENKKAGINPLTYLQPEHPLVQALGISKETAEHFGAGYAPKGIMRGRLAIPIHDVDSTLVAYCGRALKGEEPKYIFPNGFEPVMYVFDIMQIKPGKLTLVREPLEVMKAHEGGLENVLALLTETITAPQLELMSSLLVNKCCETMELL